MTNIKYALLAIFASLFLTAAAQAATITVDSLSDTQANDGGCTLREAIINANADNQTGSTDCTAGAGADTINITTAGTINLLTALPNLTTDMTINGLTMASTIVRRDAAAATEFRIFTKTAGTSTISNLTVRDGIVRGATAATGEFGFGGGIANTGGQLTLTSVTVTNNRAVGGNSTGGAGGSSNGGGIFSSSAALIVTNSIVSNNTVTGGNGTGAAGGNALGGGIIILSASLTVSDSTISGNTVAGGTGASNGGGFGGGINANNGSALSMTSSTVSGNSATSEGGISVFGTAMLINSTVSNNTATNGGGGGIGNNNGNLTLTNSIISGNSATNGGGGGLLNVGTANVTSSTISGNTVNNFSGGAISNQAAGILNMTNSTVSGNTATSGGGGLRNLGTATLSSSTFSNNATTGNAGVGGGISNSGTTTLDNTIIANSLAGADCARPGGTVNATYSLIEQNLACVNGTDSNNLTGDPNLGLLANNGGATQTHALQTGSIAIDTGNSALTTDQRGLTRSVDEPSAPNGTGNLADIGAFEVQGAATGGVSTTFLVNSANDPGNGTCDAAECTLREAVNAANANVGGADQINFDPSVAGQTITLTAGQLSITDVSGTVTINGLGANQLTVSGNNASRVFSVNGGTVTSINGITITGGNADFGGGILNVGNLTLNNLTINVNTATNGGGGIRLNSGGTLTLTNSTVNNNTAASTGGGIDSNGNTSITITASTISGNTATNSSGGLANTGTLIMNNSTVSNNSSPFGGGIGNFGTATLNSSTVSNNSAATSAGGLRNANNGTTTLNNTIIANSTTGGDCVRESGTINATYSLIEQNLTCVNGTNTNNLTGDPNLGLLANNSGTTQTHAPLFGSIVIDAGNSLLTTDQRGSTRPVDLATYTNATNGTDIGAVELQLTPTAANVSIGGRVLTNDGRGLRNAIVYLTKADGETVAARTSTFGYYRFNDVEAGQTVVVSVISKRYQFNPQVISLAEDITDFDFTAQTGGEVLR